VLVPVALTLVRLVPVLLADDVELVELLALMLGDKLPAKHQAHQPACHASHRRSA
jgi:hypothetical protein